MLPARWLVAQPMDFPTVQSVSPRRSAIQLQQLHDRSRASTDTAVSASGCLVSKRSNAEATGGSGSGHRREPPAWNMVYLATAAPGASQSTGHPVMTRTTVPGMTVAWTYDTTAPGGTGTLCLDSLLSVADRCHRPWTCGPIGSQHRQRSSSGTFRPLSEATPFHGTAYDLRQA